MKKVQRMLNFHTYKRLFCANCDVIAKIFALLKFMIIVILFASWDGISKKILILKFIQRRSGTTISLHHSTKMLNTIK